GEDPYLASRYGEAVVRGFQGDDPAAPGRLSACLKHFVGYGAPMGGRDYDAAEIGVPTLFDVYAAPFAAALAAGAQAVMPGFHALNGVPLHAHGPLIEDWLRRERGFEGIVVSDYTAIAELTAHGIGNRDARVVRALLAGVDCDMVSGDYMAVLPRLAETGLTDPDTGLDISSSTIRVAIERACARVLTLKHRLGLFEDPMHGATPGATPGVAHGAPPAPTPATRALARRAAAASAVLLANDDVLPLAPGQRLALIGPLGDDRANMLGTWAVSGDPTTPGTIREGLVAAGFDTAFAPGSPVEDDPAIIDRLNFVPGTVTPDPRDAETLMAEAEALVATADTVVLVVGEAKEHTGECASRLAPVVPAAQARLARRIQALARARAKPVVLVVLAGRPLALEDLEDGADALLYAWFAGTEMGNGLADLLSGRAEPTGRLAISLPAHPGQTPIHHGAPETGRPWPGHWQKFTTNYIDQPDDEAPGRGRWPFGHGLGYAPLSFSAPTVERTVLNGPADRARIRVAVANMGERPSTAVVQLYVSDPAARIQRPSQELKGFQRLTLAPSQTGEVTFTLGAEDLAYTIEGADGRPVRVWDPGAVIVRTGPNAVDTQAITLRWKP
ncbi:MAG: glycoside hydrolase family 3 C-terminal domain-containing protein, partial [Pseudomonadota bacterium]